MNKTLTFYCYGCQTKLSKDRVDALKLLGTPLDVWSCINCASNKKLKGVYLGEYGTSELIHCSDVYGESLSSIFDIADDRSSSTEEPKIEPVKQAEI